MKLKVYFAYINDHQGNHVLKTKYFASSKQAAAVANSIIQETPPAMGFDIRFMEVDTKKIAELLNGALLFFFIPNPLIIIN